MDIEVLEGVFDANEIIAKENRALLDERNAFMMNLMASPGAGKTSFIMKTLEGIASFPPPRGGRIKEGVTLTPLLLLPVPPRSHQVLRCSRTSIL